MTTIWTVVTSTDGKGPKRLTRDQAIEALRTGGDRQCLIHTSQRGLWWCAGGRGYTDDRARAGRYSLSDAIDIIRTSGPEKGNRIEIPGDDS